MKKNIEKGKLNKACNGANFEEWSVSFLQFLRIYTYYDLVLSVFSDLGGLIDLIQI